MRNTPSWKLMERIGMRREGCLIHTNLVNDEWIDDDVYAILDKEWSGIPKGTSATTTTEATPRQPDRPH